MQASGSHAAADSDHADDGAAAASRSRADEATDDQPEVVASPAAGRPHWSYLAMPRPIDSATKAPFTPVMYVLTMAGSAAREGQSVVAALAVWITFEVLFYASRYAANDLYDREADALHPAAKRRGRIPPRLSSRAVLTMIVVRLVSVVVVLAVLPSGARTDLLGAIVAATVVSLVYELLRNSSRRPLPDGVSRSPAMARALWLWVGTGYGVRVALGAALGGGEPILVLLAGVAGWLFGITFVLQTWTLEAAGLHAVNDRSTLAKKAHVSSTVPSDGTDWYVLRTGWPAQRAACVSLVSLGTAAWMGRQLVQVLDLRSALGIIVLSLISAALVVLLQPRNPWLVVLVVGAVIITTTTIVTRNFGANVAVALGPIGMALFTNTYIARRGPELVGFERPVGPATESALAG